MSILPTISLGGSECRFYLLSNNRVGKTSPAVGCGRRNEGLLHRELTAIKGRLFKAGGQVRIELCILRL